MQYMGSKNKISKHLLPIITKDLKKDQYYVEPFCGGCNMIDKIVHDKRLASDSHYYLIEMFKALQKGWTPPTKISKEKYYEIKNSYDNEPPELVGFVGFLCSFGSKWWGGYAFNNKGDNYAARGSRCMVKQIRNLQNVTFLNENYWNLDIPNNSIIYCDPPYADTTRYATSFDHDTFWKWCEKKSKNNKVFVSEYTAPKNWTCIKEVNYKTILDKNRQYPRTEKLFVLL